MRGACLRAIVGFVMAGLSLLAVCSVALASPQVGISQSYRDAGLAFPEAPTYKPEESVFNSVDWSPLHIQYARVVIAYNIAQREPSDHRRIEFENWLTRIEELGIEPFVVLGPSELQLTENKAEYVAPFSSTYTSAVKRFIEVYGPLTHWDVRILGAWNEPNFNDPGVPGGPKGAVRLPQKEAPGYSSRLLSQLPSGSCTSTTNCGPMLAAYYWLDARNAMKEACPKNEDPHGNQCATIAGEFSGSQSSEAETYWTDFAHSPTATEAAEKDFGSNRPQWVSFHGWPDGNPGTSCKPASESSCMSRKFRNWQVALGGQWASAATWDTEVGAKVDQLEEGSLSSQSTRVTNLLEVSSKNSIARIYYYNFQTRGEENSGLIETYPGANEVTDTETYPAWNVIRCRVACGQAPGVKTREAWVETTTAHMIAVVNPAGSAITSCVLEYGTSTSYGSSVTLPSCVGVAGDDPLEGVATATGLAHTTTYHYRVAATNAYGTTYGHDREFTTS